MNSPQASLSATPIALTVELDLAVVTAGQRPPAPLSREPAGLLAGAIAADLARIVDQQIQQCGLILPGALYDVTELLRPGLPWVELLLEVYRGSLAGAGFRPQIIGLGGDGRFPIAALAPQRRPGSGPLLILPILLTGIGDGIDRIQQQLEEVLLERGRASMETEQLIRHHFQLDPVNLSYATFNDLSALLKIQLGHAGLDALWELLESALFRPDQTQQARLPEGNVFVGRDGKVATLFTSFDEWAAEGGDVESFGLWLRQQRIYETGLAAHGLTIHRLRRPAQLESGCAGRLDQLIGEFEITDDVLREAESSPDAALDNAAVILLTEHATPTLGPIAYTVLVQAADGEVLHMSNEYPLTAAAALGVREHWAETATRLDLVLHLAQPGEILVSEDGRHLMPQVDFGDGAH